MSVRAPVSGPLGLCLDFYRLWAQRYQLILLLAYRDIVDRFAGSLIGIVWIIAHPLCLLSVYVAVFSLVFRIRFNSVGAVPGLDYAAFFIAGYLPWMAIQDGALRSCTSIIQSHNLVKQVVFPIEVLPLRSILTSAIPQAVGLAFLCIYLLCTTGRLPATIVLLPFALLVQFAGLAGTAYFLAAVSVVVRDTREVVTVLSTMGLYLLPIIYVPDALPPSFRMLLACNPLSHLIWMNHDIFLYGSITRPFSWALSTLVASTLFLGGFGLFQRIKHGFGNRL